MSLLLLHRAATAPARIYRTPTHKLVLLCLADSAGDGDGIALPGRDALEAWALVGRSRLYEVLEELIADGLIARVSSGGRGRGRARYLVFPQAPSTGGDEQEGSGTADPSYPQEGSAPAPDPMASQGPLRVRSGSAQGPADTLNRGHVREYGSTGGEGSTYSTSPTDARDPAAPHDGPAPRPLSPQAAATLRAREEHQLRRARALEAADRLELGARRRADRIGADPVPAGST